MKFPLFLKKIFLEIATSVCEDTFIGKHQIFIPKIRHKKNNTTKPYKMRTTTVFFYPVKSLDGGWDFFYYVLYFLIKTLFYTYF